MLLVFWGWIFIYQIKCDNYILYDPRSDELIVNNPQCKLQVNTVGEASFLIYASHPYYDRLRKLRSVFEILQDGQPIFRGRMTEDSIDFDNSLSVDLEGVMAYFNDSIIRPFVFPDDFNGASSSENVIEFFLNWLIEQHNSQVQDFQRFKLGKVTVTDPNNYLARSSTDYSKTWEILKSKLFESDLGGYLCIRYEEDGNYIDYLEDFEFTNIQRVEYGANLLDISSESDASETYSAIIPLGAKHKEIDEASDDESRLTIVGETDGNVSNDIVKSGDTLYSQKAVEEYGWIYAPTKDTTWEDVTAADTLQRKGIEYLAEKATKLSNTIKITAIDLHFSDSEIEAFRIYRYIAVNSKPHNHEDRYKLTALDIDILNPQNTKITLGDTKLSMTSSNSSNKQELSEMVTNIKIQSTQQGTDISEVQNIVNSQSSSVVTTCEEIIFGALASYVETSNYSAFKSTVESQLSIMAEEISLNFTDTISRIENVNGDLQEKFNTVTKYFSFDIDGLTIGQTDSPYKVVIDNDRYSMVVNGVEVLWLDGKGEAHIPEIAVTRKMDIFGFSFERDELGNVNCEYVGGGA